MIWMYVVQLCVLLYPVALLLDQMVAIYLEKKHLYYPMMEFSCFCGNFKLSLMKPRWFPLKTINFLKIRKHTQSCLVWMLNVDFEGLTPYFGNSLNDGSMTLSRDWYLNYAKERSKLAKQGRPWWVIDPDGK